MTLPEILDAALRGVQARQARRRWAGLRVLRSARQWTVESDDGARRIVARDVAERRRVWNRAEFLARELIVL